MDRFLVVYLEDKMGAVMVGRQRLPHDAVVLFRPRRSTNTDDISIGKPLTTIAYRV
jgi:hypothetical protein